MPKWAESIIDFPDEIRECTASEHEKDPCIIDSISKVTLQQARLYLDGWLSVDMCTILVYNQPPRSTQPSIPLKINK